MGVYGTLSLKVSKKTLMDDQRAPFVEKIYQWALRIRGFVACWTNDDRCESVRSRIAYWKKSYNTLGSNCIMDECVHSSSDSRTSCKSEKCVQTDFRKCAKFSVDARGSITFGLARSETFTSSLEDPNIAKYDAQLHCFPAANIFANRSLYDHPGFKLGHHVLQ